MAFPGGRVDPEDISPLHAALRECREEVALDLDATSKLLGRLNLVPIIARGRRLDMTIAPFVFELLAPVEFELNEEVDAVHWVPLHRLINPSERAPYPYRREGIDLALPSVPLGDRSIWGLTLGMTDDLLDRIDAAPAFRRPRPAS